MKAEQGTHVKVPITANKRETRARINSRGPDEGVACGRLAVYTQSTRRTALSPCASPVRGARIFPISQAKTEPQECDVNCP